jgi:hypothetical protein
MLERAGSLTPIQRSSGAGQRTMNSVQCCAVCLETRPSDAPRFGGQRVCPSCRQALSRLERSSAYRGLPRASVLAVFAAEVAVRQPNSAERWSRRLAG